MIDRLYHWQHLNYGRAIDVHKPFEANLFGTIVYCSLMERDYLDTLQLMHGRSVEMMAIWDWFDKEWDKLLDQRQNYNMTDVFSNICSTSSELPRVLDKRDHWNMSRRKRQAEDSYARRNDPQITYVGKPFKGFL